MPDYEKLYFALFNAVTDAVEFLKQAQQTGEQRYIADGGLPLILLRGGNESREPDE